MKTAMIHPLAKTMARLCNEMHARGLAHGRSGNVSAREGRLLWVTPRGFALREVMPEHLVIVASDGRLIADEGLEPTSELPMHQAIYAARPDIQAIVHAHPPRATALAIAHHPLNTPVHSEMIQTLGEIPLVPYARPGSPELGRATAEALSAHDAVLLANHGVVAVGQTLEDAFYNLELVESFAAIYLDARMLGGLNTLTPEQVQALREEN